MAFRTRPIRKRPAARRFSHVFILVSLAVIILLAFWPVFHNDYVNYDDDTYVTENRRVQEGLTWNGLLWAFQSTRASNWHPLTWLSHMLDVDLFGLSPAGHHLVSLIVHMFNAILLYLVFRWMTGAVWCSGVLSALFAVHPLHVESVAWISERKDVLSTAFGLLSIAAYYWYVLERTPRRYFLLMILFALGLMAKPMLVTLPLVLLLLDFWPLRRWRRGGMEHGFPSRYLLLEKAPLLTFAAVSSFITYYAQLKGGAVKSVDFYPLADRISNALLSYVGYVWKMMWPHKLAVFYPHPRDSLSLWAVAGAAFVLAALSVLVARSARRRPFLAVGWLWYLLTLVPVIGLVQVGAQSMADRYTYVPLIGLWIMLIWGADDLSRRWAHKGIVMCVLMAPAFSALVIATNAQARHWRNSISLFEHAVEVTSGNYVAHVNLGEALQIEGRTEESKLHLRRALLIKPDDADAHNNLGVALFSQGKTVEAIHHYEEAVRLNDNYSQAHNNLGNALNKSGRVEEAILHLEKAIRLNPSYAKAHYNLGITLSGNGRTREAIPYFLESLRLNPRFTWAYWNLGMAYVSMGEREAAMGVYKSLSREDPQLARKFSKFLKSR